MRIALVMILMVASSVANATPCRTLAVDAKQLYFVSAHSIYAAPRAGGPSVLLVENAVADGAECIVSDGTRVLYPSGMSVAAVPVGGGAPVKVATFAHWVGQLVLDGNELYVQTSWETDTAAGWEVHALAGGKTRLVTSSTTGIDRIAVDATDVYWSSRDGGIHAVAKTGGTVRLVTTGLEERTDLAIDAANIYYVANETLWRVAKTGAKRGTRVGGKLFLPSALQVDDKRAFMMTGRGIVAIGKTTGTVQRLTTGESIGEVLVDGNQLLWNETGVVQRMPLTGGKAVKVASDIERRASPVVTQLAAATTLAQKQEMPMELALTPDGKSIVFVNSGEGELGGGLSVITGGTSRLLHKGIAELPVTDGTDVIYVDFNGVWSVPIAGGTPKHVAKTAMPDEMVLGVALDADYIYWSEHEAGVVKRASRATGAVTTLATKQIGIDRVVVDDRFVYWSASPTMQMGNEIQPRAIIQRVSKQGGTPQVVVATGHAHDFAIAGDRAYWLAPHGNVMTCKTDGTGARSLGVLAGAPNALAIASDGVYVTDASLGTVTRIATSSTITIVYRGERTYGVAARGGVLAWTEMGRALWTGKVLRL